MAIKAAAQVWGQFTLSDGEMTVPVFIMAIPGGESGVYSYGPVAPSQVTEAAILAWARGIANNDLGANLTPVVDTVKLVSGIGGLL